MMLWGEIIVLIEKWNYQSKEQYSPMKNWHGIKARVKKIHGDHTHGDTFDGSKQRMVEN